MGHFKAQKKTALSGGFFCTVKPDSVPSLSRIGQLFIWDCCYQQPQAALHSHAVMFSNFKNSAARPGTALHASRNFAVAPDMFPYRLILADFLASRLGRLCSHPYPRGRWGLPITILRLTARVSGLSSPSPKRR